MLVSIKCVVFAMIRPLIRQGNHVSLSPSKGDKGEQTDCRAHHSHLGQVNHLSQRNIKKVDYRPIFHKEDNPAHMTREDRREKDAAVAARHRAEGGTRWARGSLALINCESKQFNKLPSGFVCLSVCLQS